MKNENKTASTCLCRRFFLPSFVVIRFFGICLLQPDACLLTNTGGLPTFKAIPSISSISSVWIQYK